MRLLGTTIFFALGIGFISAVCSLVVHPLLPWLLILATAVWATLDARKLRSKHLGQSASLPTRDTIITLQCCKPIVVCCLCLGPWPLGFAWYLVMRRSLFVVTISNQSQFHDD
jgi:hypothetical protein